MVPSEGGVLVFCLATNSVLLGFAVTLLGTP